MRLLVVHAWMRGNLGDVLQLSVLLSALRDLGPEALDLAGYPATPASATTDMLALVDRYQADPFIRFWMFAPRAVQAQVIEPWWRRRRAALFARYDAIICAPGPYLASYDPRAASALADIALAADLGKPLVLAGHSIGPLDDRALRVIARASACVAREPATRDYLAQRGVASTLAADFAFLYPYDKVSTPLSDGPPCRVVFLRSNNLRARSLRLVGGALFAGDTVLSPASEHPLTLATSDIRRDASFLASTAARLKLPWVGCRTIPELVGLVRRASSVVSDRYHPVICAAALGKPARVIPNREPHKMQGLTDLLAGHTLDQLQDYARAGLEAVRKAIRTAV
jgi:polysaccharide pyruvyl transferase WcaK-like protein